MLRSTSVQKMTTTLATDEVDSRPKPKPKPKAKQTTSTVVVPRPESLPTRETRSTSAPERDLHSSLRDDVSVSSTLHASASQPSLQTTVASASVTDLTDDACGLKPVTIAMEEASGRDLLTSSVEDLEGGGLLSSPKLVAPAAANPKLMSWNSVTSECETPQVRESAHLSHRPPSHSSPDAAPPTDTFAERWESQSWRTTSDITHDSGLQALSAGALRCLTHIMQKWSDDDVTQLIGDIIKPTPLIVMANHVSSAVRAAVVQVSFRLSR